MPGLRHADANFNFCQHKISETTLSYNSTLRQRRTPHLSHSHVVARFFAAAFDALFAFRLTAPFFATNFFGGFTACAEPPFFFAPPLTVFRGPALRTPSTTRISFAESPTG